MKYVHDVKMVKKWDEASQIILFNWGKLEGIWIKGGKK